MRTSTACSSAAVLTRMLSWRSVSDSTASTWMPYASLNAGGAAAAPSTRANSAMSTASAYARVRALPRWKAMTMVAESIDGSRKPKASALPAAVKL